MIFLQFFMKYSSLGNGLLASNADHKGPHSGHTDRLLRYRKCSDLNRNYYKFLLECNVFSNCPTQQGVRSNEKKAQKVDPFQSWFFVSSDHYWTVLGWLKPFLTFRDQFWGLGVVKGKKIWNFQTGQILTVRCNFWPK